MSKHGKKYAAAAAKVETGKLYTPKAAAELVKESSFAGFDETIEATFRLGVDTRKADQNIRGSIALPHGTGKSVRVAVFAEGEQARAAEEAVRRHRSAPTTSSPRFRLATSTSTLQSPPRR